MNDLQITCFVEVARAGRFSAAADRLYLSKPTVSYQIRSLESELGMTLFSRTANATELTEAGQVFLPFAQRLIKDFAAAKKAMVRECTRGNLHLAVPPGLFLIDTQLVRQIASQVELQTGLTISCEPIPSSPEESVRDLLDGQIDLLIVARHSAQRHSDELDMIPLFESGKYVLMSQNHPLVKKETISPADLAGETLLMSDEDNCFLPEIRSCILRAGIDATWRHLSSYRVLMPFVEMGQGLTFFPRQVPEMKNVIFRRFELDRAQSIVLCSLKKQQGAQLLRVKQIIRCAVASIYGEQ